MAKGLMSSKEVVIRYPIVNSSWGFYVEKGLCDYLRKYMDDDELYGNKNGGVYPYGIRGFFLRRSSVDDIDTGMNNSDPWGRSFKVYKGGLGRSCMGVYGCVPIFSRITVGEGIPAAYLLSTSVEGSMVYCLDEILCYWT